MRISIKSNFFQLLKILRNICVKDTLVSFIKAWRFILNYSKKLNTRKIMVLLTSLAHKNTSNLHI